LQVYGDLVNSRIIDREPEPPRESHDGAEADAEWLVVGRLAPPEQRVTVAARESLLEELNSGLSRPLSVIVSPPGFGKTTLLTQWWRALRESPDLYICWLSVDKIDAEVSRFIAGVILAVARAGVDVGALEVVARQQSIDTNVEPSALALLDAIRRSGKRTVLILDDYHRACSPAVDEVVETLIEHGQGHLHIVVSGRSRPRLHVSALLARGLVTMLDANDLALSIEQAAQVFGALVSADDLALLHARTEGWAVALQLARLWVERGNHKPEALRKFSGLTTEMTDYLAEQIVEDLPSELQGFLLETAILERFDARIADVVRDRSDSGEFLKHLDRFEALLVPLDDAREWYRYHPLFADFLVQRLKRATAQSRLDELHRRAANALAAFGDLPVAVQHALAAEDTQLAVALVHEAGGWELILRKGIGYVRSILMLFDPLTIRSQPALQITQAYLDLKLGCFDAAGELLALAATFGDGVSERMRRDFSIVNSLWRVYTDDVADDQWIRDVEGIYANLEPTDYLGRGTLSCGIAVCALSCGDAAKAEAASRRAIREMRSSGSILGVNYAFLHCAQSHLLRGQLREAETLFREALSMAEENFGADSGLKALCNTFVGYCLYLKGDRAASNPLIGSLVDTTDGWVDVFATAYEVQVRQAFAYGGLSQAAEVIAVASRRARERHLNRLSQMAAAWRVELLALSGHETDAKREAIAAGIEAAAELRGAPGFRWRVRLSATIAVGRLLAANGSSAQALQLIESAIKEFRDAGLMLPVRRLEALAIVVLKQRGAVEEALTRLQRLLEYVASESAIGILLEQGRALENLLLLSQRRNRELILSGAQRDLIGQVIALMRRDEQSEQFGFSGREYAVLRELCSGRSNKAIGEALDLSENTVKFHLKRIFKKLGTDSRAGAVTMALQKGLVSIDDTPRTRQ
jgi:LuxR family transcriptional regulator, maltose regulon positive regulatory protein